MNRKIYFIMLKDSDFDLKFGLRYDSVMFSMKYSDCIIILNVSVSLFVLYL